MFVLTSKSKSADALVMLVQIACVSAYWKYCYAYMTAATHMYASTVTGVHGRKERPTTRNGHLTIKYLTHESVHLIRKHNLH